MNDSTSNDVIDAHPSERILIVDSERRVFVRRIAEYGPVNYPVAKRGVYEFGLSVEIYKIGETRWTEIATNLTEAQQRKFVRHLDAWMCGREIAFKETQQYGITPWEFDCAKLVEHLKTEKA